MTERTNSGKGDAVTSRRRFLRNGGALAGGAVVAVSLAGSEASAAAENAETQCPAMDENAWRSHGKPALRTAFALRKECHQEHPEEPVAIFLGIQAIPLISWNRVSSAADRPKGA